MGNNGKDLPKKFEVGLKMYHYHIIFGKPRKFISNPPYILTRLFSLKRLVLTQTIFLFPLSLYKYRPINLRPIGIFLHFLCFLLVE